MLPTLTAILTAQKSYAAAPCSSSPIQQTPIASDDDCGSDGPVQRAASASCEECIVISRRVAAGMPGRHTGGCTGSPSPRSRRPTDGPGASSSSTTRRRGWPRDEPRRPVPAGLPGSGAVRPLRGSPGRSGRAPAGTTGSMTACGLLWERTGGNLVRATRTRRRGGRPRRAPPGAGTRGADRHGEDLLRRSGRDR
jgi:hypothetical protein